MNPLLVETFMSMLILAYIAMAVTFVFQQKKGKTFLESFDKALASGCVLFLVGYGVNASAYVTGSWI